MYISRKLDNIINRIEKLNITTDNLCSSEFSFNTFGIYTTILGIVFSTMFAIKFTWISESILRIISYIVLFAISVAVMTLWRWNWKLISTLKDWQDVTRKLDHYANDLNDKHHVLASEYEKKSDNLEQLNQHYNVLIAVLRMNGLDLGASITNMLQEKEIKR